MEKQKNIPQLRFPAFEGEWEKKKLCEVGNFLGGGTPSTQNTNYWKGEIPWISSSDLLEDNIYEINSTRYITSDAVANSATKLVPPNSILIVSRVGVGKVAVNKVGLCTSQDFTNLIPNSDDFIFLAYLIKLKTNSLLGFNQGTSIKGFVKSDLETLEIHLPTLPEQTYIASFFIAIDKKLTELKQKKTLLEQYKKGVMQKLFSQELRFKDDDGKEFPKWEKKKLSEIAKFRRGSFPQPYGLEKWYDDINGLPFIQVFDVDDNFKLKHTTKSKISDEAKPFSVFVEKGTIVLTLQGSIGRIAITQYDSYVDRTLLIFENYKVPINKYFFMYSVYLLFQIEKEKAPGGTIKTITKEVLSDFFIHLPGIDEQTKIANFLSAIDEKINHTQIQIQQTEQYKKGLLQKMFC